MSRFRESSGGDEWEVSEPHAVPQLPEPRVVEVDSKDILDNILFHQILFVASGVVQTLCAQVAFYEGGGGPTTLLPVAANYFGIALAVLFPAAHAPVLATKITATGDRIPPPVSRPSGSDFFSRGWACLPEVSSMAGKGIFVLALLDFVGHTTSIVALTMAGSGTYQVIYATVVVFAAVWCQVFLKRIMSTRHWAAVLTAAFGLGVSVVGHERSHAGSEADQNDHDYVVGVILSVFATFVFSFHYTVVEYILSRPDAPDPHALQRRLGVYLSGLVSVWLVIYTLPNFSTLVLEGLHEGAGTVVIAIYFCLMLASFVHVVTFFKIMDKQGAVSAGILQCARSVAVFILSHVSFCPTHEEQCFTTAKGLSALIVTAAILYFTTLPAPKKATTA